jgi:ankyrin repeat protein
MRQNIPTRHPTTCDWLFDHPDFISWTETNTSKPLWISGNPGMGKTVLSKYLVAKFEAKKNWSNRVLYYFFSDQDENRRSAISLLRSLIHQCLSHRPALVRPHVIPSFDTQGENLLNSFPTLWSIFINLACDAQVGGMICILDALDECKEDSRDELLQQIGNYFSTDTLSKCNYQYKPGMKLIITSRPYERIRIRLFPYTIIRLQAEKEGKVISRDIEAYVDYEVEQLGRLRGYSKDLKQVVHNALLTGADGMFLWVSLMVKLLQRTPAKHVAQSVKKMPEGIDSIYRRILNEVPQGSEKTVSSILKWIAYAFRPLTLTELGIACAIQPAYNSLSTVPIEEREGILDDIKFCGPLVKVQDDTVHLVHQTTKEFLIQSWASNNHISNYLIAGNEAHSELATACLTYLSFDELEQSPKIFDYRGDKSYNSFIADYPLLQYAAVYWYQHIKRSGETSRNLQKAVQNSLLGEKKRQLSFNIHQHELTKDLIGKQSSLHILIRAGLTLFAENAILLGSAENDHKDERKSTALHLASERGQETIVKLLLAKGSQVNAEQEIECLAESTVSTPLHLAAENGHDRVVELLLQNGASVNAEETMIHYWDRSTSTKRYRGASSTKRYRTTLHIASEKGYTTIVRKLLEFGANVNSEQYEYESHTCFGDQHFYLCAFDLAAQNGHYEVCRLLQEHGGVASTYDNNVGWEEVIDI